MSAETKTAGDDLKKARAMAIKEFVIGERKVLVRSPETMDDKRAPKVYRRVADVLVDMFLEERHSVRRNKDGEIYNSTTWRRPLYRVWEIINGAKYTDKFTVNGKEYSRDNFYYYEPVTRADVKHFLKKEIEGLGYNVRFDDQEERQDAQGNWLNAETFVKVFVGEAKRR